MQKRKTKFRDVVKTSDRRDAATHAVRLRQSEYISSLRTRVTIAEAYCGRKGRAGTAKKSGAVDCIGCIKALAALPRR